MPKIKDLSPKFKIPIAERELEVPFVAGALPLGERMGGLQMYSNVFKRGYGDKVFGSSEEGIWLGAADFVNAPFTVDMQGRIFSKSGNGGVTIDGVNVRITLHDGTVPRGLWGDDGN
ncbi:hypothetical protein IID21_05160 [Patescibacteria group bacterium]|nr:hypothetical protein [Patescibacteria group bacterium]